MRKIYIIIIMLCISFQVPCFAATVTLETCAQAGLESAISAASSGDTIIVPAGECTWTSDITVSDGLTIRGAGVLSTIIASDTFIEVFIGSNSWVEGIALVNGLARGTSGSQNWVAKDCKFGNTTGTRQDITLSGLNQPAHQTGVFHKCTIEGIRFVIDGKHVGEEEWAYPDDLGGTEHVIYIEGCTIDPITLGTGAVGDGARGGSAVWRFNTFTDGHVQTHGSRGANQRGYRKFEWYRNTITRTWNTNYAFWDRGGFGVMFDNNCTGTESGCRYQIDTERVYEDWSGVCASDNLWDNNPHPETGDSFACRDATGTGQDKTPPSANLPAYQNQQTYSPGYFWNNKYGGGTGDFHATNGGETFIVENRDYFLDSSSTAGYGLGGVTTGVYASIPTCNAAKNNHGYWATDMGGDWNSTTEWSGADGALYVCDGVGTWNLYYTPVQYPHPLIAARNSSAPGSGKRVGWSGSGGSFR